MFPGVLMHVFRLLENHLIIKKWLLYLNAVSGSQTIHTIPYFIISTICTVLPGFIYPYRITVPTDQFIMVHIQFYPTAPTPGAYHERFITKAGLLPGKLHMNRLIIAEEVSSRSVRYVRDGFYIFYSYKISQRYPPFVLENY
jgi:hypothetical protein